MGAHPDISMEDLADAMANGEFELHYQPKVLLANDCITGVEALVRWRRTDGELVAPARFIPLAEATGQIVAIGAWVIEEGCRQVREWQGAFGAGPPLTLSVNVAARQFGGDLATTLAGILDRTGLEPRSLCLEVTESTVMEDVGATAATLQELKRLGTTVSIDDFGTGYSSLGYLKRLPLDEVKIDRSFVAALGREAKDTSIIAAITAMAHALGLMVVAEGVETPAQLGELRVIGCDEAQGYYFSRPVPPAELASLLASEDPGCSGRPAAGPWGRRPGEREVVVVADNSADMRELCTAILGAEGFEVHTAADGASALELGRRVRPDCALLDVAMPGMDGFEACAAFRDDPVLANCTIVMLTALAGPEDKILGFSAGADDYIVKPFAPRDLVSRVRISIRRRQGRLAPPVE